MRYSLYRARISSIENFRYLYVNIFEIQCTSHRPNLTFAAVLYVHARRIGETLKSERMRKPQQLSFLDTVLYKLKNITRRYANAFMKITSGERRRILLPIYSAILYKIVDIIGMLEEAVILSLPVEVFSESTTNTVESDRIDAAIGEREAEAQDTEIMPESVVILLCGRMNVEPQHKDMLREETNGEHNDECHYHLRHFLAGLHLLYLQCDVHRHLKCARCVCCIN